MSAPDQQGSLFEVEPWGPAVSTAAASVQRRASAPAVNDMHKVLPVITFALDPGYVIVQAGAADEQVWSRRYIGSDQVARTPPEEAAVVQQLLDSGLLGYGGGRLVLLGRHRARANAVVLSSGTADWLYRCGRINGIDPKVTDWKAGGAPG